MNNNFQWAKVSFLEIQHMFNGIKQNSSTLKLTRSKRITLTKNIMSCVKKNK